MTLTTDTTARDASVAVVLSCIAQKTCQSFIRRDKSGRRVRRAQMHSSLPQASLLISPARSRVFSWKSWAPGGLPLVLSPMATATAFEKASTKHTRNNKLSRATICLPLHPDCYQTGSLEEERLASLQLQWGRMLKRPTTAKHPTDEAGWYGMHFPHTIGLETLLKIKIFMQNNFYSRIIWAGHKSPVKSIRW